MVNRERVSLSDSSERLGRWLMSTCFFFLSGHPLFDARRWPGAMGRRAVLLLGVELDDQLLLDLRVDDAAGRERVDQDLHVARDGLQPRRHRPGTGLRLRDDERRELLRLLAERDDVVVLHPVRRDVDLGAVDQEVAVLDQLPGHVPGLERALRTIALAALEEQLHLFPAAAPAVSTCVTSHFSLLLRPGGASADGNRCAAAA